MGAQAGVGADGGADERIEAEALVERLEVQVDPRRGAHAFDAPLRHVPGVGLSAEQDAVGAELRDADDDRLVAAVKQTVQDPAADPRDAVKAGAARSRKVQRGRTSRRTSRAYGGAVTPPASRAGERRPGSCASRRSAARRAPGADRGSGRSCALVWRRTSARVAAPATKPVAAAAAACTAGAASPASASGWRAPRPARARPLRSPRRRPERSRSSTTSASTIAADPLCGGLVAGHRRHMVTAYAVRIKAASHPVDGDDRRLRLPLVRCRHR